MTLRRSLLLLACLVLAPWPSAAQSTLYPRRISVGTNPTPPDGSSVRLQDLLTSGGTDFVVLDAEGDAIRRALSTSDIPSVFTRRDVAEAVNAAWSFNAGFSSHAASTFTNSISVSLLATLSGGYAAGAASTIDGDLALLGNGRRLRGDFSTATLANRAAVQTSTTNGQTHLLALPNGTSTTASVGAANAADPTNASQAQLLATPTEVSLRSGIAGSGSYLPLTLYTGGAERFSWLTDGTGVVQGGTLRTNSYASGTTGWAITGAGEADVRSLLADQVQTTAWITDLEQALNGGQIISKSNAFVAQTFTCPALGGTATLWVRDYPSAADMRVFAVNDWVVLRLFARADSDADGNLEMTVADCVGQVSGYADQVNGAQTWTFTRGSGANGGSASVGASIPVETIALDFGASGSGLLETTVLDGAEGSYSPYLQVFDWATSPIAVNRTVRTRLGKVTGLTGVAGEYGLLAGTYAATDGRYLRATNTAFELHGIDLTIWDGSVQAFLLRRNSGAPYFSMGNPAPTTYGTGTGAWMGDDAGTYKFRVGNPAANRLTWDGSTLTVVGDGSGITSINGGNIQTSTITATQLAAGSVTAGKISVGTLSAIAADLGTITAGTLSAVTINAPTIQSAGKWSLTDAAGLLFDDTSSDTDYTRMLRWSSGSFMRGQGSSLYLKTGLAFDGGYGAIFMQGSASSGGEVAFTSYDGASTSFASFAANAGGASTLFVGHIIPSTGASVQDDTYTIGASAARYQNINLALPNNTSPSFVIVNKGGGGADQFSALGYVAGFSGTKAMGTCSVTMVAGIITAVTGC